MNPAEAELGPDATLRTKPADHGPSWARKFSVANAIAKEICAPQTPGFAGEMNFFELFLNRLLTPEQGRGYKPPIDDVAADAAGAVRNLLETSRV